MITAIGAALAAGLMLAPAPVPAQDLNTLQRHLEHQQAVRVQDHQNRMRQGGPTRRAERDDRACSADALPAADRRAMEGEYARRFRSDGRASADAWIREQGKRFHQQLVDDGVCPG